MSSINKIVKESGINFSGSLLGNVIGYFWLMILTRALAPDQFGIFSLAQSIINVALVFVLFGTPRALDRFIPYFRANKEPGKIKEVLILVLRFVLLTSLVIGLLLFSFSGLFANTIFNKADLKPVLRILVIAIPLFAFTRIVSYAFIGFKELRYQVYLKQISEPTIKILFSVVLLVFGFGLIAWSWFYVAAILITALFALWIFRNRLFTKFRQIPAVKVDLKEIISYSWPISIASIVLILISQIDFLIIGYYLPSSEVGIYRIYIFLAGFLGLVMTSFARIYKPVVSELIPQNKTGEIKDTYIRVTKWIFLINALGLIILGFFGNDLIRIFFTDKYLTAPLVLLVLGTGKFLNSSFGPEGMTLEAYSNTKLTMINTLIMLVCNVVLDLILIPRMGILGAAIASSVTLFIGGLAGLIEIYILYKMQPYTPGYLKYFLVAASTIFIVYGIIKFIPELNIIWIFFLMCVTTALYFGGLFITKSLDDVDNEAIRNILKRTSSLMRRT